MLRSDLKGGVRALSRRPAYALAIVVTLSLGIGANAAIFSVVDPLLLRALPFAEPDRLVSVWTEGALPVGGLDLLRERASRFGELMGYALPEPVTLTGRGEPVRLRAAPVSAGFFSVLGVDPAYGRTFGPRDDEPGRDRGVVLSHRLFERRFGGDPEVVGGVLALDGVDRTIVGVMPADFRFPEDATDLWLPVTRNPADVGAYWGRYVNVVGRLRPGATLAGAQRDLDRTMPLIRDGFPWRMPASYGQSATVAPLQDKLLGGVSLLLYLLLAAGGFALLIACVNTANLLLTRGEERRGEVALRTALGAGRSQLARQLAVENLLLGLCGGVGGLALGYASVDVLRAYLPPETPRLAEIAVDVRVVLFTAALTLFTTLMFGLLPVLRMSRPDPRNVIGDLKASAPGGGRRRRLSAALVASQVAITAVLGIGAGLLVQSFWSLLRADLGFRAEGVVTATVAPPEHRFSEERHRRFYDAFLERVRALPGVESAALTDRFPFSGEVFVQAFVIDGRPFPAAGDWPLADAHQIVSPGYFQTMAIPLLEGRTFTEQDHPDAPRVAVVSRQLAERYWPGRSVLGERIKPPRGEQWLTIVGVVGDVKQGSVAEEARPTLYRPLAQLPPRPMAVIVRSAGAAPSPGPGLRSIVRELDAETPITAIRRLREVIGESVARQRLGMALLLAFAVLGLTLSVTGVYGVVSRSVGRRRHEIAVRLALGADRESITRRVVLDGTRLVLAGLAVGIAVALGLTRYLVSLVYRVDVVDPPTFAAVAVLLAVVGTLASYLPARRAVRIDPLEALRSE